MKNQLITSYGDGVTLPSLPSNATWRIDKMKNGRTWCNSAPYKFDDFDGAVCLGEIGSTGVYNFILQMANKKPILAECIIKLN